MHVYAYTYIYMYRCTFIYQRYTYIQHILTYTRLVFNKTFYTSYLQNLVGPETHVYPQVTASTKSDSQYKNSVQ